MKNILNDIFDSLLTVMTIAEKLDEKIKGDLKGYAELHGYDWVIVKNSDGYAVYEYNRDINYPLDHDDVVSDSTPLLQAFKMIMTKQRVFVKTSNQLTHIATISDLDKIPFRIWLFGIISLVEMKLKKNIDENMGDSWRKFLSPERIEKATGLYNLKQERNEEISLLQCIQFCDIGSILSKNSTLFPQFFEKYPKKKFNLAFKKLNTLRDEVAHSNNSLSLGWDDILNVVELCEYLNDEKLHLKP